MASRTAQFSPRAESHQQGHASMSITEHAVQVISQMRTNVESQVGSVQQFLARTLIDIEEQENETWQKDQKLREAERKIERLEAENRNLRSQLPNIVPDCQLSDASLKSEIIAIQENISNWAEDLPDVIGFPRVFEDTMRRLNMEIRMHSGLDEFPQQPFGAQPEILTFVTFEILWNSLFRELFSLKPFDSGFLQELRSKKRWSRAEHGKCTFMFSVSNTTNTSRNREFHHVDVQYRPGLCFSPAAQIPTRSASSPTVCRHTQLPPSSLSRD